MVVAIAGVVDVEGGFCGRGQRVEDYADDWRLAFKAITGTDTYVCIYL
jgi:hypothetical protein